MKRVSNSTKVRSKKPIKDIFMNKKELYPSNIHEYIKLELDEDSLFLKEEPMIKVERIDENLIIFSYGYWSIVFLRKEELNFWVNVRVGTIKGLQVTSNPDNVQRDLNSINIDFETQKKWKKEVMSQWKHSCKVLLNEAEKHFRGKKLTSVIHCEISIKLLKQIKDDRLKIFHPDVCVLFL